MYIVKNNSGEVIAKVASVKKAIDAAEQSFQCGIKEKHAEVCMGLRWSGHAIVEHKIQDGLFCFIEKV